MFRVGAKLCHIKYSAKTFPALMESLGATPDANAWGNLVFDDCGKSSPVCTSQKTCVMHPTTHNPSAAKTKEQNKPTNQHHHQQQTMAEETVPQEMTGLKKNR